MAMVRKNEQKKKSNKTVHSTGKYPFYYATMIVDYVALCYLMDFTDDTKLNK